LSGHFSSINYLMYKKERFIIKEKKARLSRWIL
jgi:hypothetical protein